MKTAHILAFPSAPASGPAAPSGPWAAALDQVQSPVATTAPELAISEVWQAVQEGRVCMHYQPQFDLQTGQIQGAEALVRLVDRDGQLVLPERFIKKLEASDMIVAFGQTVIAEVCRDMADLRQAGSSVASVAINVSAHQLNTDDSLLATVDQNLKHYGLQHADLEFELTERQQLRADDRGCDTLRQLAQLGSTISLDDFGAGYSSVLCLMDLPFSTIKLDRAIVERLPGDDQAREVVRSVLDLAKKLNREVIAEGIEHNAQRYWLSDAGCHGGQGFGLARPMALDALHLQLQAEAVPLLAATAG